jgi:hypothetical protein
MKCLEPKGTQVLVNMRHLRNQGHELVTSITVLGEAINQSYKKGKDYTKIVDILRKLDFDVSYPTEQTIRETVLVWDFHQDNEIYGASTVDIVHFTYAIRSECDYFVTSEGETRGLKCPSGAKKQTKSITLQKLMAAPCS